jgi:hypothetical protein
MDKVQQQAIFEAIGELLRDQKADTEAMIKAALDAGPDAVQRALYNRELVECQKSLGEHCHTMLRRKGATQDRKNIVNPILKAGLA